MTELEIGEIARSHGIRGEVVVRLVTNRLDRLDPGARLSTRTKERRSVPSVLEVIASRPHQGRFLVTFAGVDSREGADALRGVVLLADEVEGDDDELYVHRLIGRTVRDQDGVDRGRVVSVEANPASDLLVLESGALVPLRFVESANDETITVRAPEGLFG